MCETGIEHDDGWLSVPKTDLTYQHSKPFPGPCHALVSCSSSGGTRAQYAKTTAVLVVSTRERDRRVWGVEKRARKGNPDLSVPFENYDPSQGTMPLVDQRARA